MTFPKEYKFQASEPREMQICTLQDKEFKIIILRKLSEVRGQSKFNEIRKKQCINKTRS